MFQKVDGITKSIGKLFIICSFFFNAFINFWFYDDFSPKIKNIFLNIYNPLLSFLSIVFSFLLFCLDYSPLKNKFRVFQSYKMYLEVAVCLFYNPIRLSAHQTYNSVFSRIIFSLLPLIVSFLRRSRQGMVVVVKNLRR